MSEARKIHLIEVARMGRMNNLSSKITDDLLLTLCCKVKGFLYVVQ
jgi:hypothetical protein